MAWLYSACCRQKRGPDLSRATFCSGVQCLLSLNLMSRGWKQVQFCNCLVVAYVKLQYCISCSNENIRSHTAQSSSLPEQRRKQSRPVVSIGWSPGLLGAAASPQLLNRSHSMLSMASASSAWEACTWRASCTKADSHAVLLLPDLQQYRHDSLQLACIQCIMASCQPAFALCR